ncbi:hypothetical protein RvY_16472 [Ramazzottius varieornatus]|uniref:Uncharacterized protein n=1 Tax=Ramazzottius varieornatus TaxID=947166 RepID=A0A1D1VZW3_RAMVA|nr:hypothetical protein RvY_16472 [Ramazzottius varieornatus]
MDSRKAALLLVLLVHYFGFALAQKELDDEDYARFNRPETSDSDSTIQDTISIPSGKAVKRVTVVDFGEPSPDNITIVTGNTGISSLNFNRPSPATPTLTEAIVTETGSLAQAGQAVTSSSTRTSTVGAAEETTSDPDPSSNSTSTTTESPPATSAASSVVTSPSTAVNGTVGTTTTTTESIGEQLSTSTLPTFTLPPSGSMTTATSNTTDGTSSSTTEKPAAATNSTETFPDAVGNTTKSSNATETEPGSSATTVPSFVNATSSLPDNGTSLVHSTNSASVTPTSSTTSSPQLANPCKVLGDGLRSGTFESIVLPSTCSLFVPPATVVASTGQAFNNGTQFAAPGTDLVEYSVISASEGAEIINRLSLRPVTTPGANQEVILRNYGNTSSPLPTQPNLPINNPFAAAQPLGGPGSHFISPASQSPIATGLSSQGSGFQGWGAPALAPVAPTSPYANLPAPYAAAAIMGLANQGWGGIQGMAQAGGIGLPGTDADWTAPSRNRLSSILGFGPNYGPSSPTAGVLGLMGPASPSNSGWGRAEPLAERSTGLANRRHPNGLISALQSWGDDSSSSFPYQSRHPSAYGPLAEPSDDNEIVMTADGPISVPRSTLALYAPRLTSLYLQQPGPSQAYRSPGLYDSDLVLKKTKDATTIGKIATLLAKEAARAASRRKRASIDPALVMSLGTGSPKDEWSRNLNALVVRAFNETDQQQRKVHAAIVTVPESTWENKQQLAARDELVSLCVQRCLGVMDPQFNCAARCRIAPKSF